MGDLLGLYEGSFVGEAEGLLVGGIVEIIDGSLVGDAVTGCIEGDIIAAVVARFRTTCSNH